MTTQEIRIGQVVSVQFPKHEVRIAPETDVADRWERLTVATFRDRAGARHEWPVKDWRTAGRNVVLVLDGPTDDQLAALRKATIVVAPEERGTLPDDMFFLDDVIGVDVFDVEGGKIGVVEDTLQTLAQVLLDVRTINGELYTIAVAEETVPELDTEARRIAVDTRHLMSQDGFPYAERSAGHAD